MTRLIHVADGLSAALKRSPYYCDNPGKPECQNVGKSIGHCKKVDCRHLRRSPVTKTVRQSENILLGNKHLEMALSLALV